jgi:hypothetical protein
MWDHVEECIEIGLQIDNEDGAECVFPTLWGWLRDADDRLMNIIGDIEGGVRLNTMFSNVLLTPDLLNEISFFAELHEELLHRCRSVKLENDLVPEKWKVAYWDRVLEATAEFEWPVEMLKTQVIDRRIKVKT